MNERILTKAAKEKPKGRKSTFTPEIGAIIVDILGHLKYGAPEKTAYEAVGIVYNTYQKWQEDFPDFGEKVKKAKAEAQLFFLQNVAAAVKRHDSEHTRKGVRTEIRMRKTTTIEGKVKTITEEPITVTLPYEETMIGRNESDTRAAIEILKRRWPKDFGDRQDVTSQMQFSTDKTVLDILNEAISGDE